jgi:tRNA pseudouridine38-40 synthase
MREAAVYLVGTHDFASFGQPPQGDNTVRAVLRSTLVVQAHEPQTIVYTVEANAFLYRMVRRIVGALVRVGKEQLSPQAFEQALHAADNTWPNQTAPPTGLCLVNVSY